MCPQKVIIFNSLLLPPSQTFILDPAEKLQAFIPYYCGSRRVSGLTLPPERTIVVNHGKPWGKLQELLFKTLGFAPSFAKNLHQLPPALIHAQFGLSGALILPFAQKTNLPLIVHYRGADATIDPRQGRWRSLNHWLYWQRLGTLKEHTHRFLAVSQFIRQKMIAQGFPGSKIQVHYHGVDVEKFQSDPNVARKNQVLFIGRFTEKKGVKYLIEAIAQLQIQLPHVELILIGDGEQRPTLERLARQQLSHYQFLGKQPPAVVKEYLNQVKVLAAPSVTARNGDAEGLPNVVQEAQAMGVPVVSTYHAGIPEAVADGQTGFLTEEKDVEALARGIHQLLTQEALWQRFSQAARENMVQNFNRRKQVAKLEEIYQEVIANHGR